MHIGALQGGGLVLGYRCSSRCRHCPYACGPHRRDGDGDDQALEQVLDLLAERGPGARYHIGRGEGIGESSGLLQLRENQALGAALQVV